jgi:hypothetical protein
MIGLSLANLLSRNLGALAHAVKRAMSVEEGERRSEFLKNQFRLRCSAD